MQGKHVLNMKTPVIMGLVGAIMFIDPDFTQFQCAHGGGGCSSLLRKTQLHLAFLGALVHDLVDCSGHIEFWMELEVLQQMCDKASKVLVEPIVVECPKHTSLPRGEL